MELDQFSAALAAATTRLAALQPQLAGEVPAGRLPHVTELGKWEWAPFGQSGRWDSDRWSHGYWTGGFVAGWYWRASEIVPEAQAFRDTAELVTRALAVRADDRITHDVGFLSWPSAVLGAMITGKVEFAELGRRAAMALLGRRHPSGIIQAWGDLSDPRARGSSTIDTMMNLPLLWWAGREGVAGAREAAIAHAAASSRLYIRSDGTTFHRLRLDEDGTPTERGTYQGYADNSCWSRGQAWAVHGFADAYRATGRVEFKQAAQRTIDAFLERLPDDGIAPWDFDDPNWRDAPRDASATAIVAAGLLKLAAWERTQSGESRESARWLAAGTRLAEALVAHAANTSDADGLLLRSTYSVPHRSGVSGAVTWGDYFYLECLALLTGAGRFADPVTGVGQP